MPRKGEHLRQWKWRSCSAGRTAPEPSASSVGRGKWRAKTSRKALGFRRPMDQNEGGAKDRGRKEGPERERNGRAIRLPPSFVFHWCSTTRLLEPTFRVAKNKQTMDDRVNRIGRPAVNESSESQQDEAHLVGADDGLDGQVVVDDLLVGAEGAGGGGRCEGGQLRHQRRHRHLVAAGRRQRRRRLVRVARRRSGAGAAEERVPRLQTRDKIHHQDLKEHSVANLNRTRHRLGRSVWGGPMAQCPTRNDKDRLEIPTSTKKTDTVVITKHSPWRLSRCVFSNLEAGQHFVGHLSSGI